MTGEINNPCNKVHAKQDNERLKVVDLNAGAGKDFSLRISVKVYLFENLSLHSNLRFFNAFNLFCVFNHRRL